MSSAGTRVDLSYVEETTAGETPATPSMKELRATVRNINPSKNILDSEEVKDHRQMVDQRHGFNSVGGNIDFELAYEDYDDMLEAALGGSWTSEAAGTPNTLDIGNTLRTFTIERRFNDISKFQVFKGVAINELSLSVQPDSLVTASLGLVGMSFDPAAGAELGTPTASAGNSAFESFSGSINEGGSSIAHLTGIDFTLTNNRQVNPVLLSKTAQEVDEGQVEITGTITARFKNATLLDKFINETESSMDFQLDDIGGTEYLKFTFPRIKYNGGEIDPPQTGPVIINLPFVALYDSATSTALQIERSNAA